MIDHILQQNELTMSCIILKVKSVSANSNGYDIDYSSDAAYICGVKANYTGEWSSVRGWGVFPCPATHRLPMTP